jgi:3-methyladenine DNA glycosylase Tag
MAKTVGIAFGVQQVASFAFEVAKLAGEAEGVKAAFDKLPNSVQLLTQLKEATAGTVSELELMKRTVQATNFGISLEALPKLLEFAAIRAQQTGQSVDYLVDSIVTGIGRKSPLILDNLGISAVALKEKMGGVAITAASIGEVSEAVGKIATDELKKMGDFSENTATKVARLEASWTNFKVSLGKTSFVGGLASATEDFLNFFNTLLGGQPSVEQMREGLDFLIKGLNSGELSTEAYARGFKEAGEVADKLGIRLIKLTDEASGLSKVLVDTTTKIQTIVGPSTAQQITTLDTLQEKIKQLNEQFESTNIVDQKRLSNIGAEIIAVNAQIKKLEELRKAREASNLKPDTIDAYQEAIAKLNKELEETNVKDTSRIRILSAQIAGYDAAIGRINELKKSFSGDLQLTLATPDTSALNDIFDVATGKLKEFKNEFGTLTHTSTIMEEVTARIEKSMGSLANTTQKTTEAVGQSFVDLGGPISTALAGFGEALGNAIAGVGNFGEDILKIVAGFGKQLGQILIAEGVALLAAKLALKNPYTAIAAGIALVAISTAASAAIGSSHQKSFGGAGAAATGGSSGSTGGGSVERFTRTPTEQVILVGGEIKWNGNTLALALDRAYKSKERTG